MTRQTHEPGCPRRAVVAATAVTLALATLVIHAQSTAAPQGRAPVAQPANPLDKPGALAKENLAKNRPRIGTTVASATCRCRS